MFTDSLHNSKDYGLKVQLVLFSFQLTIMHYFVLIFHLKKHKSLMLYQVKAA